MDRSETLKLTIKSLLEVVQTGAKNIEIAVMSSDSNATGGADVGQGVGAGKSTEKSKGAKLEMLPTEEIERFVEEINREKAEEAEKKKPGRGGGGGGGGAGGAADSEGLAEMTERPAVGEGVTEPSAGQ